MSAPARLGDVVAAMAGLFPAHWADDGDPVGLVVGADEDVVRRCLFAVDPVQAVVDEAVEVEAQLIVAHHPLLFRPVHSVAATSPKGRAVHDLVRNGIGLLVAHTNADSPPGGVSEALAIALGLEALRPLVPEPAEPLDKIVTFVPLADADRVIDALAAAGAGEVGDYSRCAFVSDGVGTFEPGPGADPAIGAVGEVTVVAERRVEMVLPRNRRAAVVAALRVAHPYEEPAFDVLTLAEWPGERGAGRVGTIATPTTLADFAARVAAALPPTAGGVRVAGEADRVVRKVAVLGGAGDSYLADARAEDVDVYVTSDLRHHPASEFTEHVDGPALVDVSHWAAEWTWLPGSAAALRTRLLDAGYDVDCVVSRRCTDPWTMHIPSPTIDPRSAS